MNTKDEENGEVGGPLIFTVPAYGFVMALYLDWLGRSNRAVSAKTRRWDYPTRSVNDSVSLSRYGVQDSTPKTLGG